jgi:tetratricopeptide (TPR) repeat protein
LDAAEALYRKALNQDASRPKYTRALALNGIASIYFKKGDFKRALEYCAKALEVKPDFDSARNNLVRVLAQLNQWDRVAEQIDLQLNRRRNSKVYQFLKGELLLKQNQPAEALVYLRKALKSAPHDKKILLNIGIALQRMNQIRQAEWFLNRVKREWPNDIRPYIHLIGLGLNSENSVKTERYLNDLLTRFTLNRLNIEQPDCLDGVGLTDASRKLICRVVSDKIILLADDMIRKGER